MMQDRITQILQQMNEMQNEPVKMAIGGETIGPGIGMPDFDPIRDAVSTQTNSDADNAPFTQVYGQRRSTPLSMDEYLSGSMYDFAGINVSATPGIDDDDKDDKDKDQEAPPNILTRVDERDDPSQVFRAISQTGQLGMGYQVANVDPSKYLDRLLSEETFTIKEDGFSKYAQQKFTEGGGVVTAAAGLAMGNPALGVLAAGAAALAEKQNKKNAQAIMQTGGGDLFTLNGAYVSRAPGEKIFTGNLGGFSQEQLYASREMDFGFIPGSMREMVAASTDPYAVKGKKDLMKRSGNRGVVEAGVVSGHIMDAYGTIHGVSDESGVMQVGAIAAQRMRENEFRQNMIAAGLGAELTKMEKNNTLTMNAVRAKQHTDGIMKAGQGFRFRAANVPADQYANALSNRGTTYRDFLTSTHGTGSTTTSTTPSITASKTPLRRSPSYFDDVTPRRLVEAVAGQALSERRAKEKADRESGLVTPGTDPTFPRGESYEYPPPRTEVLDPEGPGYTRVEDDSAGFDYSGFFDSPSPQPDSRTTTESVRSSQIEERFSDRDRFGAYGGRINMAAGDTPQATFEPGFVKGPPENFTERETVADDQNGKVKPDTFIINAAAVEIAGSEDIRNMLMKAYEVAVQKGLDIGRVDRKLYEGTVDVALSKGEVVVPPELAKIIGYDRLRKINNRGKKEVASRQKKAGGGFLAKKKLASGGETPKVLPKPKPSPSERRAARKEPERIADVELRADLEEFIRDDQLARLGWDLYTSGELQLVGIPTPFDYTRVIKGEGEDARETVRDEMAYRYAGSYYPTPDRATAPAFPFEKDGPRVKVRSSRYPSATVREYLDKIGGTYSEETPIAQYFAEPMYITKRNRTDPERYMGDKASVMLTLAHELRHAALNHLMYDYGAPEMTVNGEERLMDYFDQKGRKQASKNNALVLAESPYIGVAERGKSAVQLTIYKKEAELYNSLAAEVLKIRGVPPVAQPEEKGFISRFIDGLFRESPQSKLRKGDGKPVDYESEAMQSAQF